MITERPPRARARREAFARSDALDRIDLPADDRLRRPARKIERALAAEDRAAVEEACREFLRAAAAFYGVPAPAVRVLAARPRRVYRDGGATELFGDYDLETGLIRVWMRTAVRKRVTSFGTFLSTLCHEFCHHLDRHGLGFPETPHTRGFYARTARLYHHARGTPYRELHWIALPGGAFRVDWARLRGRGRFDGREGGP
ncbi:MAG: hypothetical protein D6718_00850 [Acidobacteria bacterium]|nr:MAG: hypothetical protein D6718_00850 [Acidobacteriota bacterium]